MSAQVLEAVDLRVRLYTPTTTVHAVNGVTFSVPPGGTLAVVGESGSGKTVMTLAPFGLLTGSVSLDIDGSIRVGGDELVGRSERELSQIRGERVGFVFQDPLSAFNPMRRIGVQVAEPTRLHLGLSRGAALDRAAELMALVGLPDARRRLDLYPHELSGGMRQRAMIAMALAAEPAVLIADEPTTALDTTVQAQILELLADLRERLGMAIVLITHDIGVVARMADSVAVMYAGRIVERGPVRDVLRVPDHPYTQGLLASIPSSSAAPGTRFAGLPGAPPDLSIVRPGCAFAPRCAHAVAACHAVRPPLEPLRGRGSRHFAACHVHPAPTALTRVEVGA